MPSDTKKKLMKDIELANNRLIQLNKKKTEDELERIKIEEALRAGKRNCTKGTTSLTR